jgi:hypothetical protein
MWIQTQPKMRQDSIRRVFCCKKEKEVVAVHMGGIKHGRHCHKMEKA